MPEPLEVFGGPDRVEALIGAGRIADAERALAGLGQWAERPDRPRITARTLRCRGLLLAAGADLAAADTAMEQAIAAEARAPMPFEHGRALLELGRVRRRRNRRREARGLLGEAARMFAALGARVWEEKARRELARVGGRTPAAEGELTPTERRVAELVAEGRSNREVAAAVFVTAKTVEVYLSRIYAKLGIHSRTELARRLFEESRTGKL
jgi:DNA-binding CsgD family transcriptional regulator